MARKGEAVPVSSLSFLPTLPPLLAPSFLPSLPSSLLLSHLPPSLPLLHRYILTAFPCRTPSTTLGCGYKVVNTSLGLHEVDLLVGERDNKLLVGERLHLP